RVVAWSRASHRRLWQTAVGTHRNDRGPLPRRRVLVCPGLYGGVLTPMAYADGTLFVPVVDLCTRGGAHGYEPLAQIAAHARGRGELGALAGATGRRLWRASLPQPVFSCATVSGGVVFTGTFDGRLYAFDTRSGASLWTARMRASLNACPAVA